MELEQVTQDIMIWVEHFLEQPNQALRGWSPCPYAKQARLKNTVQVVLGNDPYSDLKNISNCGIGLYEVVICVYNPEQLTYDEICVSVHSANTELLLPNNLIALYEHPNHKNIVNGVCMNQGQYVLVLIQNLIKLNELACRLASKGFYDSWSEEYLQILFKDRIDPRQS